MTMPLALPTSPPVARPRATTAPGYAANAPMRAVNDERCSLGTPRDEAFVRGAAAAASLLFAVAWLDAIARIAALYG